MRPTRAVRAQPLDTRGRSVTLAPCACAEATSDLLAGSWQVSYLLRMTGFRSTAMATTVRARRAR